MAGYVGRQSGEGVFPPEKLAELSEKLRTCHSWLNVRHYLESNEFRLHRTVSCDTHLVCPLCAIRRSARQVRKYWERFELIRAGHGALRLYYVVLTVKNGPDLAERFRHLQKAVKTFLQRRRDAQKARKGSRANAYALNSCFADVVGGTYSFEVKRGAGSDEWHPHINLLLLVDGELDARALSAEWESITGDSKIVHCSEKEAGAFPFVEVFKYALKFSEMTLADNYEAYRTLKGKKLLGSFGAFRGVKVLAGDEEEALDEPYFDYIFRYLNGEYAEAYDKGSGLVVVPGIGDTG